MSASIRPADLAKEVGLSTQQIRNLEAEGLLPPAERNAVGHRVYEERHRLALYVERAMMRAGFHGRQRRAVMDAVHAGDPDSALQPVVERFVEIDSLRRQIEEVIERAHEPVLPAVWNKDRLRVSETAQIVGVTAAALRHWELEGLIKPTRDLASGYRMYDRGLVRRASLIARLVALGFGMQAIGPIIDDMASDQPGLLDTTRDALRRPVVTQVGACTEATALLWRYVDEGR